MNTASSLRTMVGALVATAICTSTALAAKSQGAKLTLADNKVTVAGQPKGVGSTIAPGETIVTGLRSRAEVTLPDGTVARIGQGSSFSFDGSKLTLSQGSALFNITGKNAKIVTPALTRTGSPGVVSVHASHDYNALFDLKGSDKVNGATLVAGQAWVSENGGTRTFTFDMQKMVGSSTLVTKFPQAPWVAQTAALANVQHQLIAVGQRGINSTVATGSTTATVGNSGKPPGFFARLSSAFSGWSSTQGGPVSVSGATLNLGTGTVAGTDTIAGRGASGTLTLSDVGTGGLTKIDAGTLSIGNGTFATLSGANTKPLTTSAGGILLVNPTAGAGVNTVQNGGTLQNGTVTGAAGGYFGSSGVSATAISTSGSNITFGTVSNTVPLTLNTGNLVLSNGGLNPNTISLPNGLGTIGTINGINISTLQPGQNVTLGGIAYSVMTSANGALTLTRITVPQTLSSAPMPVATRPAGR